MKKKYNSKFFKFPIEVESVNWNKLVIITTSLWKKVIYSWYDLDKKQSDLVYINKCLLGWFIKKIPKSVLILGLWWGSFARYLEDHIDNIQITWVDIDYTMIEISKKEMEVKSESLICMDAKIAVSKLYKENRKFDLILIDCYWLDSEIPDWLITKIFFENCKKVLEKDWVVSINMANFLLDDNSENIKRTNKYREMHNNLKEVFWEYFSLLTYGKQNWENSMWIYNLDKYYTAKDFDDNYLEKVDVWEIKYDYNMVFNTFVDEEKVFLD